MPPASHGLLAAFQFCLFENLAHAEVHPLLGAGKFLLGQSIRDDQMQQIFAFGKIVQPQLGHVIKALRVCAGRDFQQPGRELMNWFAVAVDFGLHCDLRRSVFLVSCGVVNCGTVLQPANARKLADVRRGRQAAGRRGHQRSLRY